MVEPQPSKLTTGVRFSSSAPYVKIVAPSDVEIKLNPKELSFFVFKKAGNKKTIIDLATAPIVKRHR